MESCELKILLAKSVRMLVKLQMQRLSHQTQRLSVKVASFLTKVVGMKSLQT